jgi:large subunit ribosomal protein L10
MNRDQKAAVIDEIAADITSAQAIFAVDYRGITVAQAEALRTRLRENDATFRVVKNSLTERAADKAGAEELKGLLAGPTALTFAKGDAAAAAKAVADFARVTQLLAFKGGVMDGAALTAADVGAISRLPSREVLYGQLVGLVASPISNLARTLNALVGGLAIGLSGVLAKKESGELPGAVSADRGPAAPAGASAEPAGASEEASHADTSGVAAHEAGDSAEAVGAAGAETVEALEHGSDAEAAGAVEAAPGAEVADAEAQAPGAADAAEEEEPVAEEPVAAEPVAAETTATATDDVSAPEASGDDDDEKE